MNRTRHLLKEAWIVGSTASAVSTLALIAAGGAENDRAAAPINAISHWLWRRKAFRQDGISGKYTFAGYLIHHAASVFWAALFGCVRQRLRPASLPADLAAGIAVSAAACAVDYRCTPERFTPGFERRLSRTSMGLVYLAFGVGLAVATRALGRGTSST